jgi:lipoate-protein ligase B
MKSGWWNMPVFTQGQAGKAEHVLVTGDIPVIQSDRGGQVTYHGPGQQVMYVLLNLKRRKLGVRELVTCWNKPSSIRWRNMVLKRIRAPMRRASTWRKKICSGCASVKVAHFTAWR